MPDGTPTDIPVGRWLDLRVEMPAGEEPEPEIIPEPEKSEESEPGETEEPKEWQ